MAYYLLNNVNDGVFMMIDIDMSKYDSVEYESRTCVECTYAFHTNGSKSIVCDRCKEEIFKC